MELHFTPYVWLYVVSAALMLPLIVFLLRHRSSPGATAFLVMSLALIVDAIGAGIVISSSSIAAAALGVQIQLTGLALVPLAWIIFAMRYTGRGAQLADRSSVLVGLLPIVTVLFVWTNDAHGLIWRSMNVTDIGLFTRVSIEFGPWYWAYALVSAVLLLLGAALLIHEAASTIRLYRAQSLALLAGITLPVLLEGINLVYPQILPSGLDFVSPSFAIASLLLCWAAFEYRLFDIVPAQRWAVVESLVDAIIVLDQDARVVDLNAAGSEFLDCKPSDVIGKPILQVFPDRPDLIERYRDAAEARIEFTHRAASSIRHYEMRLSPLKDTHQQTTGRIMLLRDITERKQTEQRLAYLSTHDALTNIYNRAYFEAEMQRLQSGRHFPVTVVMADVNHLKQVNDHLGHAAGDDLLRRAAMVLQAAFRAEDMIARIGGDEFVVLLPDADTAAVESAVRRVKSCLAAHNAAQDGRPLSMAVGAACSQPGISLEQALQLADERMYADKIRLNIVSTMPRR